MRKLFIALAAIATCLVTPAVAQSVTYYVDAAGNRVAVTPAAPLPVTVPASGQVVAQTHGHSFCRISTATTTTCKSGAGVLHSISVGTLGTGTTSAVVYDNTAGSGTIVASINTLSGQTTYLYDVAFSTGLTVVTTGTTAPDITVSYR